MSILVVGINVAVGGDREGDDGRESSLRSNPMALSDDDTSMLSLTSSYCSMAVADVRVDEFFFKYLFEVSFPHAGGLDLLGVVAVFFCFFVWEKKLKIDGDGDGDDDGDSGSGTTLTFISVFVSAATGDVWNDRRDVPSCSI